MKVFLLSILAVVASAASVESTGIPGDVLCNSKVLAYEFAAKLMPERASDGGLAPVAAGLGVDPGQRLILVLIAGI